MYHERKYIICINQVCGYSVYTYIYMYLNVEIANGAMVVESRGLLQEVVSGFFEQQVPFRDGASGLLLNDVPHLIIPVRGLADLLQMTT